MEAHVQHAFRHIARDACQRFSLTAATSKLYPVMTLYVKLFRIFNTDLNVSRWDFCVKRWRSSRHSSGVVLEQEPARHEFIRVLCIWAHRRKSVFNAIECPDPVGRRESRCVENWRSRMLNCWTWPYESFGFLESLICYPVSYTHLRAHETDSYLVCRLLLEK